MDWVAGLYASYRLDDVILNIGGRMQMRYNTCLCNKQIKHGVEGNMQVYGLVGQTKEGYGPKRTGILPERPCFMCYIIPNLNLAIHCVAVFTIICFPIIFVFVQCVKNLKP